jgi:hypothetical protein
VTFVVDYPVGVWYSTLGRYGTALGHNELYGKSNERTRTSR